MAKYKLNVFSNKHTTANFVFILHQWPRLFAFTFHVNADQLDSIEIQNLTVS